MPQNAAHRCCESGFFDAPRFGISRTCLGATGGYQTKAVAIGLGKLPNSNCVRIVGTMAFTDVTGEDGATVPPLPRGSLTEIFHRLKVIEVK